MQGRIVKGIAGFYYVCVEGAGEYECRAKGIFRKENQKPLVGDRVEIAVLDEADREGSLIRILPRKNALIRPACANVDQALLIFSLRDPDPNFLLLDRFLVMMEQAGIPSGICFNKQDLVSEEERERLCAIYGDCGCRVFSASIQKGEGLEALEQFLRGRTTVVAGPSGVGKSSLTNRMQKEVQMETGEVSKKLGRGRHTTRHAQLIPLGEETYLMDTPGFSSLYLENMEKEELKGYFPEFRPYEGKCRFQGCVHIHEPDCRVREALCEGRISRLRYEDYLQLFEELKEKRRY